MASHHSRALCGDSCRVTAADLSVQFIHGVYPGDLTHSLLSSHASLRDLPAIDYLRVRRSISRLPSFLRYHSRFLIGFPQCAMFFFMDAALIPGYANYVRS